MTRGLSFLRGWVGVALLATALEPLGAAPLGKEAKVILSVLRSLTPRKDRPDSKFLVACLASDGKGEWAPLQRYTYCLLPSDARACLIAGIRRGGRGLEAYPRAFARCQHESGEEEGILYSRPLRRLKGPTLEIVENIIYRGSLPSFARQVAIIDAYQRSERRVAQSRPEK